MKKIFDTKLLTIGISIIGNIYQYLNNKKIKYDLNLYKQIIPIEVFEQYKFHDTNTCNNHNNIHFKKMRDQYYKYYADDDLFSEKETEPDTENNTDPMP
jgi:hypothetical protein